MAAGPPRYTMDDLNEQARFYHKIEWGTFNGYEYTSTPVVEGETPRNPGWELNVDRWPTYDERGWERVGPGVLRVPGRGLVAYWRRKRGK